MNGNENKKTDEITYTLDDIILELIDQQKDTDLQADNNGLSKQNISNYLKKLFDSMGLSDAKEILRDGKAFAFTEQEKGLIECLIVERDRKLKRYKRGENAGRIIEPDFEFLFDITNGIRAMLLKRGYDTDKLYEALEGYMTEFLKNEASVAVTMSRRIQETVERNIADSNTYLRTFEKFIWMRAMEEELTRVLDKWDGIFREYEDMMKAEVCDRIEKMYQEPYEAAGNNETAIKTNGQIFEERVGEYLEKRYKEEWEALDKRGQELLLDRERKEKFYNDKIKYYGNLIGKSSTARYSCGEESMKKIQEIAEIDKEIEQIGIRRRCIYDKCQELAYIELYGENEKIPVSGLPDAWELLWKAKANVAGERKSDKLGALQELLEEAEDRVKELRKFLDIE